MNGIPVTFIDTPGLEPSAGEQARSPPPATLPLRSSASERAHPALPCQPHAPLPPPLSFPRAGAIASNLTKLHAAKRAFNRHRPNAVLYVDRLDAGRRDLADLNVSGRRRRGRRRRVVCFCQSRAGAGRAELGGAVGRAAPCVLRSTRGADRGRPGGWLRCTQVMRSITDVFGADTWFSTVLVLTHGSTAPPDTSSGQASRACARGGAGLGGRAGQPACLAGCLAACLSD